MDGRRAQVRRTIAFSLGCWLGNLTLVADGMQEVLAGFEEVRERGLEEHFEEFRDDKDADAGGQPRAEVLHPA